MSQNNGPISRLVNQSINSVVKPKKAAPPRMAPTAADYLLGRAQVPQPPAQAPNPIANQQRQNAQAVRRMSPGIDRVANPSNERRVQIRANTPGTPENTRELVRRQVAALPIPDEWRAGVEALVDSALFIRTTYIDPETGMRRRVSPLASQNAIRQTGLLDPNDAMEVVELLKTEGGVRLLQTEVKQFQDQRNFGRGANTLLEKLAAPGNVDPNIAGIGAVIDTLSPGVKAINANLVDNPDFLNRSIENYERFVLEPLTQGVMTPYTAGLEPLRMLGVDPTAIQRTLQQFPLAINRGMVSGAASMVRIPQLLGSKEWADLADHMERGVRLAQANKPLDETFANELAGVVGAIIPQIAPALITGGSSIGASVAGRVAASIVFGATEAATNAAGGFDRAVKSGRNPFDPEQRQMNIEEARQRAFRAMPVDMIASTIFNKIGVFGESGSVAKKAFMRAFAEGEQEAFQTALGEYVATGDLDFNSPEVRKGRLFGWILGPLMGGGIDLATGTQMEGGAEAVPQRSAAASVPPVAPPVAPVTDAEPQINPGALSQSLAINTPQGAMPDFPRTVPAGMPRQQEAPQAQPQQSEPWQLSRAALKTRRVTKAQMIERGADGSLSSAVQLDIPVSKIDGREPVPEMEGGYQPGTPITQPIEVAYDPDSDTYILYSGNHRVRQAEINGQATIPAFVEGFDHKAAVLSAYQEGKPVPADVLAEYGLSPQPSQQSAPAGMPQPAQSQQAQAPTQPVAQEATQKEPWQMTREEYLAQQVKDFEELVAQSRKKLEDAKREDPNSQSIHVLESVLAFQQNVLKDLRRGKDAGPTHLHHRVIVNGNLAKGLPVPPEVLADYPDLAAKYQPQPAKAAQSQESARPQPATQTGRAEPLRAWLDSASQDDIRKLFSKNDSDVASLGLQADVSARIMALAEAQGLAGEAAQNVRAYTVPQMIANTGKPGKRLAFIVKDDTGGEWWSNTHIALLGANLKTTTEGIVQISPVITRAMQEANPISEVATIVDYTSGLYVTVFSDGTQVDAKYWEVIRKMNPDQVVSRGGGQPVVATKGGKPIALLTPLASLEARANTAARVAQSQKATPQPAPKAAQRQESARPQPATTPKPKLTGEDLARAKARKYLESDSGKGGTNQQYADSLIEEGYRARQVEVVNEAAVRKAKAIMDKAQGRSILSASRAEDDARKVIKDPPKKIEYRAQMSSGTYRVISKTLYDYMLEKASPYKDEPKPAPAQEFSQKAKDLPDDPFENLTEAEIEAVSSDARKEAVAYAKSLSDDYSASDVREYEERQFPRLTSYRKAIGDKTHAGYLKSMLESGKSVPDRVLLAQAELLEQRADNANTNTKDQYTNESNARYAQKLRDLAAYLRSATQSAQKAPAKAPESVSPGVQQAEGSTAGVAETTAQKAAETTQALGVVLRSAGYNERQVRGLMAALNPIIEQNPGAVVRAVERLDPSGKLLQEFAAPFYSKMERVAREKLPARASTEQIKKTLLASGVKPEEMLWTGVDALLAGGGVITKQDILDHIQVNQIRVEDVVKGERIAPPQEYIDAYDDLTDQRDRGGRISARAWEQEVAELNKKFGYPKDASPYDLGNRGSDPAEFQVFKMPGGENYRELLLVLPVDVTGDASMFTSEHWDEPNVLAHVRFDERTDASGNKVLHIAEIQSDWHQEGRKHGYKTGGDAADNRVPDAPFKKTWHELSMKRILRYAAENGFDSVSWDTGATNVERFKPSKPEGMVAFYDNILPDTANKIAKRFGAKVEGGTVTGFDGFVTLTAPTHLLRLTPSMKSSLLNEGQPLFQTGADGVKGAYTPVSRMVELVIGKADISTVVHEFAHDWHGFLQDHPTHGAIIRRTYGTVTNVEGAEQFARDFEKFLASGKSPAKSLQSVFEAFKRWMADIYGQVFGRNIPKDVKAIFRDAYANPSAETLRLVREFESYTAQKQPAKQEQVVYRYAPRLRPPSPGAVPREGLIGTARGGEWGVAEYNRELTSQEIRDYELDVLPPRREAVKEAPRAMTMEEREAVTIQGFRPDYADIASLPEGKRFVYDPTTGSVYDADLLRNADAAKLGLRSNVVRDGASLNTPNSYVEKYGYGRAADQAYAVDLNNGEATSAYRSAEAHAQLLDSIQRGQERVSAQAKAAELEQAAREAEWAAEAKPRTQAQQRADAKKRDAALQDLVYGTPGTVIEKRGYTDTVVSYDKKQGTVVVSRTEDGRNMGQFTLMGGLDKRDVVSITAQDGTVLYGNRKLTDAAKERVEAMLAPKKPKPQSPAEPKVVAVAKQPWQMTEAEVAEATISGRKSARFTETQVDWGGGRGQGKRVNGTVTGSMASPPKGVKTYKNYLAPLNLSAPERSEVTVLGEDARDSYIGMRGAGFGHDDAIVIAMAGHKAYIEKAVRDGKPVPANVLAEHGVAPQSPDILASPSKPAKSKDTITVDGKERPRTNSNGKPIHPTEEGIRAFWRWFGDSKVVDEQGRPLVVYHGTEADFTAFAKTSSKSGRVGDFGPGFYFTTSPEYAGLYAKERGRVYPVYLKIDDPMSVKDVYAFGGVFDQVWRTRGERSASEYTVQDYIKGRGHDGVQVTQPLVEMSGGLDTQQFFIAFDPTQIKSAIGNQGTFSPDNPSILASPRRVRRGMAPEPIKWEVAALPYDGPSIPLSDLRIDLEQAFGKLRTGTSAKGTKGVYVISPDIKYVRYGNDVVTAAHEIAHQLDARQGITNNIAGPALDQLRSGYFDRTIPENASQEVADMERFAVLVEAYVSDPERLKALTPELFGWMEKILPPKSLTALQNFSTKLRQYAGQSATAKASSSFVMGRQVNPVQRTVENIKAGSVERFTDNLTQGWLDQYGALLRSVDRIIGGGDRKEGARKRKENPLMDWEVALRDVPYTDEMFTAQMQEGFIDRRLSEQTGSVVTAPSFVQLVSHLEPGTDKFEENYRKATAYMNALRHLDWADRKKSEAEANIEAYTDAVNETKDAAIAQKRLDLMTKAVENGASNVALAIKPELDAYTKRITSIAKQKITRFSNAERKHAIRMGEESGLVAMGPGIKSTVEEARRALKELEPDMKMLRAFEKDYRALSDYNLNMLVWGGRLTPDQAATIRANNPHWFAVIRIDDREASLEEVVRAHLRPTRSIFGARNLVHSFQGSQRTKDDPLAALATRMRDVMQESHRNRALAQMTYLLKNAGFADGMEGELNRVRLEDGIAPTENQFTIWVNGEKQVWEVSKENSAVLQSMRAISMQGEDGKVLEAILNVLSKPASITRNLIINAPPFIVRNLTRDTIHRMTMVENFGPGAKVPKQSGLAESMGVGLGRSTVFEDPDSFVRRQKDALDDLTSKGHIVLRGRRAYQNLRESAEMVNRKAVFDQAYRAFRASGYNEYQATTLAAYAARESMTDFKKIGSKARALSQIIPFFSAQIAGTSTSMRQLGKNPAQVIKKLTVYSAVLMGLEQLWAALGGDDEEKELERLNNLDRYQRELFWNFRVGGDDGFWLSIPKGHEQSIYTTMVGQLAASLNEGRFGKPDSSRVPRAFVDNLLPVSTLPDAFGGWLPLVELVFNKKTFNDREIVPDYERNKEMSRRNIQYASPIGKALHGFLGVDARQWDYALEEMTGYYGRAITGMAEAENPDDAGRILLRFTGLNMPGSPTQNENVIAVDNLLRTFGKRPTGWESMKKAFFNAKTEAERQRAGRALVNRAKIVRERLEAWKPLPDEARKANVDLLFP